MPRPKKNFIKPVPTHQDTNAMSDKNETNTAPSTDTPTDTNTPPWTPDDIQPDTATATDPAPEPPKVEVQDDAGDTTPPPAPESDGDTTPPPTTGTDVQVIEGEVLPPNELTVDEARQYDEEKAVLTGLVKKAFSDREKADRSTADMMYQAYHLYCLAEHNPQVKARLEQECSEHNLDKEASHALATTRIIRLVMYQDNELRLRLQSEQERDFWKQRLNEMANSIKLLDHLAKGGDKQAKDARPPAPEQIPSNAMSKLIEAVGSATAVFRLGRAVGKDAIPFRMTFKDNQTIIENLDPAAKATKKKRESKKEDDTDDKSEKTLDADTDAINKLTKMWEGIKAEVGDESVYVVFLSVDMVETVVPVKGKKNPEVKKIPHLMSARFRVLDGDEMDKDEIVWGGGDPHEDVPKVERRIGQNVITNSKFDD